VVGVYITTKHVFEMAFAAIHHLILFFAFTQWLAHSVQCMSRLLGRFQKKLYSVFKGRGAMAVFLPFSALGHHILLHVLIQQILSFFAFSWFLCRDGTCAGKTGNTLSIGDRTDGTLCPPTGVVWARSGSQLIGPIIVS
jgi:hypothetical protein